MIGCIESITILGNRFIWWYYFI